MAASLTNRRESTTFSLPLIVAALVLGMILGGCGLKGDLYLPETTPSPAEEPAGSDDDD